MPASVKKNGAFKQLAYNAAMSPQIKHCSLKQSRHWLFSSLSSSGIQERPPSPHFQTFL